MEVINTLGRRKTSVARVYMNSGKGNIVVNGKDAKEYFPTSLLQDTPANVNRKQDSRETTNIICALQQASYFITR